MDDRLRDLVARLEICVREHAQAVQVVERRTEALEACRAELAAFLGRPVEHPRQPNPASWLVKGLGRNAAEHGWRVTNHAVSMGGVVLHLEPDA